jgi:hypothetical protein
VRSQAGPKGWQLIEGGRLGQFGAEVVIINIYDFLKVADLFGKAKEVIMR